MKLLTKTIEKKLPVLYSTENIPSEEKVVHVKFFTPWTNWTWYGIEYDAEQRLFFGYINDGYGKELGYFSLTELESVRGPVGLKIERDMYWDARKIKEI